MNILNIVLVLPPAPAALVLAGLAFATLSCLSAAALLLIIVFGPPGGVGAVGRRLVELAKLGESTGVSERGVDWGAYRLACVICDVSFINPTTGNLHVYI